MIFVPTAQFVFLQSALNMRNQDICHYNYRCKRDVHLYSYFSVQSLNSVWSNISYIVIGFALLLYFMVQERRYERKLREQNGVHYGVPCSFDVFYAVCFALMGEGLGSAFFHLCPTFWNFQFVRFVLLLLLLFLCVCVCVFVCNCVCV